MTFPRPSRADHHLSNYWNALVRNAPAEELARLARLVEPSEIAAIEQAHAAHQRFEPDPFFARRLEQTLMNTAITPLAGTLSHPPISPPSRNGTTDRGAVSHRGANVPRPRIGWARSPAFAVAMIVLLVLSTIGGIWLSTGRPDDRHVIMAPLATPDTETSPGWTQWRGDGAKSGVTNFGPVNQPVELWRFQASDACLPAPVVLGDTVYAACQDGNLYAFNRDTGEIRWTFVAESFGDLAGAGDLVYVLDDVSNTLYAVDHATGEERWRYNGAPIQGAMAVADGLIVFRSPEGLLSGIDAVTGEERWVTAITSDGGTGTPALIDGMAYAGSEPGEFTAVNAGTGEIAWQVDTGDFWNGTAVITGGIAYIGSGLDGPDGFLTAYDAESGELLWRNDESIASPTVANGIGYSSSFNGTVHAIDTATGEELWRVQIGDINRAITIGGDILYVSSDGDRSIYALDAATGAELWHIGVDGGIDNQAAVVDGEIYVTTTFGVIQAFAEPVAGDASPAAIPASPVSATPEGTSGAMPTVSQDIAVEFLWQSTGDPNDVLRAPGGPALDPDGNLWVTDAANNRFQIFSPDGAYIETWGTMGDGDGEFDFNNRRGDPGGSIADIAFAHDGSFYVADSANRRVQHFAADRAFIRAWGSFGTGNGQFADPISVAIAPNGNVYVVDDRRNDIQVFDPEGTFLFAIAEHGMGPGQLDNTGSLAIDQAGNVYVADFGNDRIQKFSGDGTFLAMIGEFGTGDGQFNGPSDIAVDQYGHLYVSDTDGGRVQIFDQDGVFMAAGNAADDGQGAFTVPGGITVDTAGHVYVTDIVAGTVQKFATSLLPGATT